MKRGFYTLGWFAVSFTWSALCYRLALPLWVAAVVGFGLGVTSVLITIGIAMARAQHSGPPAVQPDDERKKYESAINELLKREGVLLDQVDAERKGKP